MVPQHGLYSTRDSRSWATESQFFTKTEIVRASLGRIRMSKEPTVDVLLNRFSEEVQSVFYPFFVLSIIERNGSASRQEIKDEIFRLTRGTIELEVTSHNRWIGRLEKTFRLIEPLGKERDPSVVHYGLTEKGKRLYSEALEQVIYPLGDILPIE